MSASVLVVDDDPIFRAPAVRLLVAAGLTLVGEADSVATGLSAVTELEAAAALVDVGLPVGDGFSLARALTELPRRPPVVLTSVDADAADDAAARRSGALAFVPKAGPPGASLDQLFGGLQDPA